MFEKITNKCIVNPDLVEHIDKSFFKKTYIVFHPIILEEVDPEYPEINREKPLVVHAPSRRWIKGTNYVLKAVELLKSKGFKFDFQLIEGMEHEKALNVLKNADIVVDQFIVGAYGMLSIEAMAYGKPVVCFIKESLYKLYPSTLPIVNANIDNLPQKLAMLIKDGNLRYRLGVEGRKYVEKYHSEEVYYKKIMEIYKNL
jgi:UDP-N-acetylglucosamine 2-epimerase